MIDMYVWIELGLNKNRGWFLHFFAGTALWYEFKESPRAALNTLNYLPFSCHSAISKEYRPAGTSIMGPAKN